jgi:2-hydroxychromene-2-carboxylate isomerase
MSRARGRHSSLYRGCEIFGVPMFVLSSGERFWGHDRMEWALRYGFVKPADE